MATLTRQTQKVFGGNANADMLAVFGSMKTGTPQYSTNLATLQSTAYTQGWSEAILNDKAPYLEEMNAVQYGLSYQIAYLLQQGVPQYDANTEYSATSLVQVIENNELVIKRSLVDNNIGNPTTNTTYWTDFYSAAILANKADVDLSNAIPSQEFIDKVLNWTAPDWNNKVSKINNTNYVAESNGYITAYGRQAGRNATIKITINGVDAITFFQHGSGGSSPGFTLIAPIAKGDSWITTNCDGNIYFIPVKGGN